MRHGFRKYNNTKVKDDGYTFDSKAEHNRYKELKLMRSVGEICNLVVHPRWDLVVNDIKIGRYTADFEYFDKDLVKHVEDVKGVKTRDLNLRLNLMRALHGIDVKILQPRY